MRLARALAELARRQRDAAVPAALVALSEAVAQLVAELEAPESTDRAVLEFVGQLTWAPGRMDRGGVAALRAAGLDDVAIHDVVNVVCCFAYMNRLADGLGVVLNETNRAWATALFGAEALAAHLAWGEPQ